MAIVRYTASRSLTGGVILGATVTLTLPIMYAGMTRDRRIFSTRRRSLSGKRETYYESDENAWSCQTKPLKPSEQDQLVMFLDSVERGEQFLFAKDNSSAYVNALLDQPGYSEQRNPALDMLASYSFTIVQVP